MDSQASSSRNRARVIGLFVIMALSLSLLAYVGYGEASRSYPKLEIERLSAQGEVIKNAIDPFLETGLPIEDYPGFATLTQPLLESDSTIGAIVMTDAKSKVIDLNARNQAEGQAATESIFEASSLQEKGSRFRVLENQTSYRVAIDLRNKFEKVGELSLTMPRAVLQAHIDSYFRTIVLPGGIGFLILFGLVAFAITHRDPEKIKSRLVVAYGSIFFLMAVVVVVALVNIYSDGIRDKTKALSNSLSQRLQVALQLGLQLDDFTQLDVMFSDYKELYPDLSYVALTDGDKVLIHTERAREGRGWEPYANHYEYAAPLATAAGVTTLTVRAGIPQSIILERLFRSAKNFFVLFIASSLLAMMFLDLLNTFVAMPHGTRSTPQERRIFETNLVQPFLFIGMFVEALSNSFMPQHLQRVAAATGMDSSIVSLQFTVYFVALAFSLLPVGRLVEDGKMRPVLITAVVLELTSLAMMATVTNPYAIFVARMFAGAAHGILATGAQAYLMMVAQKGKQTHGASRFLFLYQGGVVAGTAMGALLAAYMGFSGVFTLAAVLATFVVIYGVVLLPNVREDEEPSVAGVAANPRPAFMPSLREAIRDFSFTNAVFFVGVPAKAISTGVISFGLPLLLARQAYAQEDIGQIIMFYPIGLLIMSAYLPHFLHRFGAPRNALVVGTLAGGIGVAFIGVMGWGTSEAAGLAGLVPIILVVGSLLIGLAHGLINAPIVAYVVTSRTGVDLGRNGINSIYRFLERIGHMTGPLIVGQLLFFSQQNASSITWLSGPVILLGVLFYLSTRQRSPVLAPAR